MNAIILGAGLGTRLRPFTNDRPKCMVEVCGEPMIERQIRFLIERGITDITVVTGYKDEKLLFLKDKYGVNLIHNPKFDTANNIYSMYLAKDKFGGTYVLEGDVYIYENFLDPDIKESTYFAMNRPYENEWGLRADDHGILKEIIVGNGEGPIMSGVSYWTQEDADKIKHRIQRLVDDDVYADLFWDNAVIDTLPDLAPVHIRECRHMFEIDTPQDLNNVERVISNLKEVH